MTFQKIVIYLLVAVLAAPSVMARQRQEPPEVWRAFAGKLEAGAFVRVELKNNKSIKGNFVMIDGDNLRVKPRTRVPVPIRDIAFADIASIDRQKGGWTPGAKVLTGVAVGVGVALLTALGIVLTLD